MSFNLEHVGKLAKLVLTEEEIKKFDVQIKEILELIEILPDVPQDSENRVNVGQRCELREDIETDSISIDEVLSNAPQKKSRVFCCTGFKIGGRK